jgi:hypothetical protein
MNAEVQKLSNRLENYAATAPPLGELEMPQFAFSLDQEVPLTSIHGITESCGAPLNINPGRLDGRSPHESIMTSKGNEDVQAQCLSVLQGSDKFSDSELVPTRLHQ